jgi:hypothetical protein
VLGRGPPVDFDSNIWPLGLRRDAVLSDAQLRALRRLQEYDLSAIRARMIGTEVLPATLVDDAIHEFRRYLAVRLVAGRPVSMLSRPVDSVWHTCLLFTRLYADLCESVFEEFVHHDPGTETLEELNAGWTDFEAQFDALFGPPGPLWQLWQPDLI